MRSRWFQRQGLAVGVIALLAGGAVAEPERASPQAVTLEYKYTAGDSFRYTSTVTGSGTTTVTGIPGQPAGREIPMELDYEITMTSKTLSVSDQGAGVLEFRIQSLTAETTMQGAQTRMVFTADGITMTVNGQEHDVPDAVRRNADMIDKPFQMTVSKRGKVLEADYSALESISKFARGMNLKQMVEMGRPQFPDKPLKPGDSWTQVLEVPLPGAAGAKGTANLNLEYTYQGMEPVNDKPCAKIQLSGTMSMDGLELAGGTGLPTGAKVSVDAMDADLDGFLYFNPEMGQIAKQVLNMGMTVSTTVSGQGPQGNAFEISSDTDLKLKTTLTVERAKPEAEADEAQGGDEAPEGQAPTPAAEE